MGRFALGGDPRPLEEKERLRLVRRAECIQDMIMSLEYRDNKTNGTPAATI
jgi:hypothetical protein